MSKHSKRRERVQEGEEEMMKGKSGEGEEGKGREGKEGERPRVYFKLSLE